MSSLDYLDLCRLCLVKDGVSVPIFEGETFLKISACLPVKVTREDKLPKKICHDCVCKVELFYDFCNTTANSEKQLLQLLGDVHMEDDKQNYIETVLSPNRMKSDEGGKNNRLEDTVMQQVSEHQNSMNIMDNIMDMPMMISGTTQQQITSVPMDTTGESVQNVPVAGPSTQMTHEQVHINQNQSDTPMQQEEEEESSEEEENFEEECDADEGLPVKEESEEDPNNRRTVEPTTFVNVSLTCEEAGPSGLQQQKIPDIPDTMVLPQTEDVDPKTGTRWTTVWDATSETFRQVMVLVNLHDGTLAKGVVEKTCGSSAKRKADEKQQEDGKKKSDSKKEVDEDSTNKEKEKSTTEKEKSITEEEKSATDEEKSTQASETTSKSQEEDKEEEEKEEKEEEEKMEIEEEDGIFKDQSADVRKCLFCSKTFATNNVLRKHLRQCHHRRAYKCDKCTTSCFTEAALAKHLMIHAEDYFFECNLCQLKYKRKLSLKNHKIRVHSNEAPRYICDSCGQFFKVKLDLSSHIKRKHDKRFHICRYCGQSTPDLASHERKHKRERGDQNLDFACTLCSRRFKHQIYLDNHMLWHKQGHKCTTCDLVFQSWSQLKYHKSREHENPTKPCPICKKNIMNTGNTFYQHVLTHAGIRPYKCDVCNEDFTQRTSLLRHRKNHPGPLQPYTPQIPIANLARNYLKTIE